MYTRVIDIVVGNGYAKRINQTLLPAAMAKIVGQIGIFSLVIKTVLGKGKLLIQTCLKLHKNWLISYLARTEMLVNTYIHVPTYNHMPTITCICTYECIHICQTPYTPTPKVHRVTMRLNKETEIKGKIIRYLKNSLEWDLI